jgi:hypothetical protein
MNFFPWKRRKAHRITVAAEPVPLTPVEEGAAHGCPAPAPSARPDGDGPTTDGARPHRRGRSANSPDKLAILAALVADGISAVVAPRIELLYRQLHDALEHRMEGLAQPLRASAAEAAEHAAALEQRVMESCSSAAQRGTQRPIIDALIALYDRVCQESQFQSLWYRKDPELTGHLGCRQLHERWESAARSYAAEVLRMLQQLGVEPIVGGGGQFDPQIQHVVSVEMTAQPELHGQIARRLRAGFTWHGQVLRSEEVIVYKKERRYGEKAD